MKWVYIIGLSFLLAACNRFCGSDENERSGVNQLSERHTQWLENGLQSYQVNYRLSCFCNQETSEVTVTNGEITAVTVRTWDGVFIRDVPAEEFANYYTIDDFFDLITQIDRVADKLSVQYNASLGYPSAIDVDPIAMHCDCLGGCSDAMDDEYTY